MNHSVIIPVRNGEALLQEQLRAIADEVSRTELAIEVIVSDNGSSDGTQDAVRRLAAESMPWLRLVDASGRRGAAAARNLGAAAAQTKDLLFLDHDDVIQPGWLEAMSTAISSYPLVAGSFDEFSLNFPRFDRLV